MHLPVPTIAPFMFQQHLLTHIRQQQIGQPMHPEYEQFNKRSPVDYFNVYGMVAH
jgi:hypothetical protein